MRRRRRYFFVAKTRRERALLSGTPRLRTVSSSTHTPAHDHDLRLGDLLADCRGVVLTEARHEIVIDRALLCEAPELSQGDAFVDQRRGDLLADCRGVVLTEAGSCCASGTTNISTGGTPDGGICRSGSSTGSWAWSTSCN
jgi:hypothetical protein